MSDVSLGLPPATEEQAPEPVHVALYSDLSIRVDIDGFSDQIAIDDPYLAISFGQKLIEMAALSLRKRAEGRGLNMKQAAPKLDLVHASLPKNLR